MLTVEILSPKNTNPFSIINEKGTTNNAYQHIDKKANTNFIWKIPQRNEGKFLPDCQTFKHEDLLTDTQRQRLMKRKFEPHLKKNNGGGRNNIQ